MKGKNKQPERLKNPEKRLLKGFSLVLLITFLSLSVAGQNLIVRGGFYFDSDKKELVKNDTMVIRSGRFFSFGSLPDGRNRSLFKTLSLSDDNVMLPGIFDMHAHYRVTFKRKRWDETVVNPVVFLANGITSTFPAGEINPAAMMSLKKGINRGERTGPRIFNTGPYFGSARPGWRQDTTVEDIRREVDALAEMGVGGLKAKGLSGNLLQALIDRGHRHGLTVSAHLDSGFRNSTNPKEAILMGLDRVEHFLGGDALTADTSAYSTLQYLDPAHPKLIEVMGLYVRHRVFFDATITAYGYYGDRAEGYDYWVDEKKFLTPYASRLVENVRQRSEMFGRIYRVKRKIIKRAFDAGVQITLGTDHPSVGEYLPGFSSHRELDVFVLSGIPPAEAIIIATLNGARSLNVADKLGSIKIGKLADFFVIRGNPLENIRNTRTVFKVVKGGVVYDTQKLFKSVKGKFGPINEADLANK